MTDQVAAGMVGSDLNDELTIVMNCVDRAQKILAADSPARPLLSEIMGAAQRCVWKASALVTMGGAMRSPVARPETWAATPQDEAVDCGTGLILGAAAAERLLRDLFPGRFA